MPEPGARAVGGRRRREPGAQLASLAHIRGPCARGLRRPADAHRAEVALQQPAPLLQPHAGALPSHGGGAAGRQGAGRSSQLKTGLAKQGSKVSASIQTVS